MQCNALNRSTIAMPISCGPPTGSGMDRSTFLVEYRLNTEKSCFEISLKVNCALYLRMQEKSNSQSSCRLISDIMCHHLSTALVLLRRDRQSSCVVSELQTFADRQSANTQRDFSAPLLFNSTKRQKGQQNEGGHDRPPALGCC